MLGKGQIVLKLFKLKLWFWLKPKNYLLEFKEIAPDFKNPVIVLIISLSFLLSRTVLYFALWN